VLDHAVWEQAVTTASSWYRSLPADKATELDRLIMDIMQLKQNLVELAISAGSTEICRTCGGECCKHGKYHVSVLDTLAYLKTGATLLTPDFSTDPYCPYSDVSGCTMAPQYRPMTCVVFNCQQIEDQLAPARQETSHEYEQELRDAITRAGHITGRRLERPLLLSSS